MTDASREGEAAGVAGVPELPPDDAAPLRLLLEVQEVDLALDQLEYRRRELPERKAADALETQQQVLDDRMRQVASTFDSLTIRQNEIDGHVGSYSSRISAIEGRLRQGGGDYREVQAMSGEIESLERQRRELEERELEVMEQLEPVEQELEVLAGERAALESAQEAAADALRAAEQAIDAETAHVRARRRELASGLPESLAADYDRLRGRLGGIGAARLVQGTCSGCHLRLASSERDRLLHAAAGAVVHCDQCGRILVA